MSYTVRIDQELCCGSGLCAAMAKAGFELDAQGVARTLSGVSDLPGDVLREVARSCPTLCIRLFDGESEVDVFA